MNDDKIVQDKPTEKSIHELLSERVDDSHQKQQDTSLYNMIHTDEVSDLTIKKASNEINLSMSKEQQERIKEDAYLFKAQERIEATISKSLEERSEDQETKKKVDQLIMESKTKVRKDLGARTNRILKEVVEYIGIVVVALLVATLVNTLLFSISNVRETSMEPTLVEGDVMLLNRLTYAFSEPESGDIIVMIESAEVDMSFVGRVKRMYSDLFNKLKGVEVKDRLVKRIVGVAGDELDIREGRLYINGEIESFAEIDVDTPTRNYFDFPIVVPEGQIFVLGDNRPVSRDSRAFGFVDLEQVEGKVGFRVFPLGKFGIVH